MHPIDFVDNSLHTKFDDKYSHNKEVIAHERKCRHLGGPCITLTLALALALALAQMSMLNCVPNFLSHFSITVLAILASILQLQVIMNIMNLL